MNDKTKKVEVNRESFDYSDDFSFLTLKEKREVLKNAKYLLRLQKDNVAMLADNKPQKENVFSIGVCR
jgi:hypothetical protein